MNVKMFQMDCGESILMHEDSEALLIDFGSQSVSSSNYYNYVENYLVTMSLICLNALITHFHDDHILGFIDLMNKGSVKFKEIYVPHIFTANSHFNLIDYILMDYYLRNQKSAGIPLLSLFKAICKSKGCYTLLERGDTFIAGGCKNEVLWPVPEVICSIGEIDDAIGKYDIPIPVDVIRKIFVISDRICRLITRHVASGDEGNLTEVFVTEIIEIEEEIKTLLTTEIIDDSKENIRLLNGMYIDGSDYGAFRDYETIKKFHAYLKNKIIKDQNAISIVFQTEDVGGKRFLFTGDITKTNLKKIIKNTDKKIALKTDFFAVKAPHHGTLGNYVADLYTHTNPEVVFISNGNGGHAGRIASAYSQSTKYRLICSNTVNPTQKCDGKPCQNAVCPVLKNSKSNYEFDIV